MATLRCQVLFCFFATTMHGIKLYCNYKLKNMTRNNNDLRYNQFLQPVKQLWASQNLVKENMRRFVLEKQY